MRRLIYGFFFVCVVTLGQSGCSGAGPAPAPEAGAPAIILVTVDGLAPSALTLFGGPRAMPNLEAFAAGARSWTDVWTPSPLSRPAVASYLTGLAPDRHGVRDNWLKSLPAGLPTLAGVLESRGYSTAAFPGSSYLAADSGLLADFQIVDDPLSVAGGGIGMLPVMAQHTEGGAENFARWVESVPAGTPYFAWIHATEPLLLQMLPAIIPGEAQELEAEERAGRIADEARLALDLLDRAIGRVISAIRDHGDLDSAAIVIVGTSGNVTGSDGSPRGPGFSMSEQALRVPIIARLPGLEPGPAPEARWGLDVPVTLAAFGGARLPDAEGLDLKVAAAPDRPLFAWSAATRDQMGWPALRAVRIGPHKRIEGSETSNLPLDPEGQTPPAEAQRRLAEALAGRGEPAAATVPLESVRGPLEARGVELDGIVAAGREFGTAEERAEVARLIWQARRKARQGDEAKALELYSRALELDGENLSGLVELARTVRDPARAMPLLTRAVGRYADNPEVLHWYAHGIWSDSWEDASQLIEVLLPFKPHEADLLYDLACARSLGGRLEESERYLREAILAGFRQWRHIETDSDLRNLRETERFAKLMQEFR